MATLIFDPRMKSGDDTMTVTLSGAIGTSDITNDSVLNADINSAAAIDWSKLATSTDVDTSGQVVDFTMTGEAQGDVLYFDGTNWVVLAAGTSGHFLKTQGAGANPKWDSISAAAVGGLTSGFTLEGGTYDPATTITAQTTAAAALTVPDLAGVAQQWVFSSATQTLANKTLTAPKIVTTGAICDAGGDEYMVFTEAVTPITYVNVISGNTTVAPQLVGAGETNTNLHLHGSGTGNVLLSDGTDPTKLVSVEVSGATTAKTTTLTFAHTDNRAITFPNATCTLASLASAEVFENKTLEATCTLVDTADNTKVIAWDATGATTGKTTTLTFVGTDNRAITFPNATVTLASLTGTETFTNKTLTDASCTFGANGALTKAAKFDLSGATAGKTSTLTFAHSDDRAITFPNATCTLTGKDTTDILTNKTVDADGTGNVFTNWNANELDPVALPAQADASDAHYGIPFVINAKISNQAAAVAIYTANAPFKFQVIDAWSVNMSADGGTWKLDNGANDLTSAITVAASDKDIDRAVDMDDDYATIASGGSLRIVPDGAGKLDAYIYISCLRVD